MKVKDKIKKKVLFYFYKCEKFVGRYTDPLVDRLFEMGERIHSK